MPTLVTSICEASLEEASFDVFVEVKEEEDSIGGGGSEAAVVDRCRGILSLIRGFSFTFKNL
jgi:hypothetical protein